MFLYSLPFIIDQFSKIIIFIVISVLLGIVILILSYFLIKQKYDNEKLSAYECGFTPFEDSRTQIDIKFYLVSILFIIFDLEVSLLFPFISSIVELDRVTY
jgi:NADH-quinone oxidoreductase subunit A